MFKVGLLTRNATVQYIVHAQTTFYFFFDIIIMNNN